ncbi:hypothetical protein Tco_0597116 [Tanacetum coccineum]
MVPQTLLTKSGLVYVNSLKRLFQKKTPNYNRYFNRSVNSVKDTRVHTARPKTEVNTVKASASWVWKPKQEVIDHVSKSNNASKTLTRYDYVDAYGRFKTGRQIWNGEFLAPFEGRLSVQFDLKEIMAVLFVNQQKYFEVINSPCYHNKELASPEQTATVLHGSSPFLGANGLTSPRVNGYLIIEASTIAISFDSSDESVGSPPSWVILFGDIPTVIPSNSVVAPETSTIVSLIYFISALVLRRLFTFPATIYTPFLCTDSSKAPDSSDGPPSQDPYVMVIARWRSKVASRLSSSYEFPIAPITAMPEIHRRLAILIRHREAFPFGRPYRTHLDGPRKLLTARKRIGPLLARRLAWRHALPCSSNHRPSSSSSSSDSFPVYSSESSSRDSSGRPLHSFSHSAGPSRKRYRSLINFIPSSTPVMGSLASTRADLLPPCKRFRDSYSSEASIEEDTKDDTEEYKTDTSAGDTVEVGIDPMSAPIVEEEIVEPVGEDSSNLSGTRDGIVRSFEDMPIDLDDAMCDFYYHMSEVRIDRIVEIETVQRRLEADQLITRGERAGMIERIKSLRLENLKVRAMLDIKRDRMNSLRLHMSLSQEAFCQVRRDRDDTRGRLRRLESTMTNTRSGMTPVIIEEMINQRVDAALEARRVNRDLRLGNGNDNGGGDANGNDTRNGNNGGDNGDGNENRNGNKRGDRPGARKCTYQDFIKCQPLSFKGTEGVVKYATCTLLDSALTWWNSHKRTIETDAAYALSWRELLKLMTEVYCLRNEIQKMETELWN